MNLTQVPQQSWSQHKHWGPSGRGISCPWLPPHRSWRCHRCRTAASWRTVTGPDPSDPLDDLPPLSDWDV